ncbi:MAG: hypothetical protein Q7V19_01045 [Bacteroidales bacterium]|nr:hypothetical protein [Bacteroidales bacterium]
MSIGLFRSSNKSIGYLVSILVIVIAFFLLEGDTWLKEAIQRGSVNIGTLHWAQIIIALIVGFILGLVFTRRGRW